jgi:4-amino-4-deoxy-L-arabinose transferase-like glycosyltransferase
LTRRHERFRVLTQYLLKDPSAHKALGGLLGCYVLLASLYSLHTPPFEAPDEYYHFAVIAHIAHTHALPPDDHPREQTWRQMVFHAPLYYMLSAALIAPMDISDFPDHYPLNPHAQIGVALAQDNANFVAHVDDWQGAALALRVVRLFSIGLGALTLISTYTLAHALTSEHIARLATFIFMLNPQWLYISSVVNNDNALTAFAALSLALLVWMLKHKPTWWGTVALSVAMAAAALSKASGMILYPVIFTAWLWLWRVGRMTLRPAIRNVAIITLGWLLIAGWWYIRNFMLYGNFSAMNMLAEATSLRRSIPDLVGELRGLYFSFWGLFGWFNISAPLAFYDWTLGSLGVAGIGLLLRLKRRFGTPIAYNQRMIVVFLALYVMLFIWAWWQFNQIVQAGQGRLWFPLWGIFAACIAWGLARLPKLMPLMLFAGMGFAAVSFPFTLLSPAYTPTPQIPIGSWQPPVNAVEMRFREPWTDHECLILWAVPPQWERREGAPITITLYWQTLCPVSGYWSVFAHFVDTQLDQCIAGDTRHVLAQVDTMPQGGRLPLPAFLPDHVVIDTLTLNPPSGIDLTREWHVQIGLYDAGVTFIRAFVKGVGNEVITVGRCASESVLMLLL